MCRHIEDGSLFAGQEPLVILVDPSLGEKLIPPCLGPVEIEVAKSRNFPASISVGAQMMRRDPTAADHGDGKGVLGWERKLMESVGSVLVMIGVVFASAID